MVGRAKEFGHSAIALTDHGSLSGVFEFYIECLKQGIKPIIGIELYMVPDVQVKEKGEKRYHLVLLALNREGYQNLLRISSMAGTEGFYYVPRADFSMLKKHRGGLVALTGCISGVLRMMDAPSGPERLLWLLKNMYCNRVYLEIMPHVNLKEQKAYNSLMLDLATKTGTPLVVTRDAHYLDADAKEAHDILMQIQNRKPYTCALDVADEDHIRDTLNKYHGYLGKKAICSALSNTEVIADMVEDYGIPIDQFEYPTFVKGYE